MATKKEETKTTVKTTAKAATKPVATKAAKPAAKKAPAKKAPAKKKEMKVTSILDYQGAQFNEADMLASVKDDFKANGGKIADIKTLDLYVKPEEYTVHYVVNGDITGSVKF